MSDAPQLHRSSSRPPVRRDRRSADPRRAARSLSAGARSSHAYASTEAGVAFAVDDGRAGFPAALVEWRWAGRDASDRRVSAASASRGAALRYLGADAPALARRGGLRRHRRSWSSGAAIAIISSAGAAASSMSAAPKVHPEEVEAVINAQPAVRASRVFARKNPITGAMVVAEVVLSDGATARDALARRNPRRLPRHAAELQGPAPIRFVADLPMTAAESWRAMDNVLVTGASRGLGLAIAERLAGEGFASIAVARKCQRGARRGERDLPASGRGAIAFEAVRSRATSTRFPLSCAISRRGVGRSTGSSTTPASAPMACSPTTRDADIETLIRAQHALADHHDQICRARHDGGRPRPHRQHRLDLALDRLQRALGLCRYQSLAGRLHALARARGRQGRRHGQRDRAGLHRNRHDEHARRSRAGAHRSPAARCGAWRNPRMSRRWRPFFSARAGATSPAR